MARLGRARAWNTAWLGAARQGTARLGPSKEHGTARFGAARLGMAGLGESKDRGAAVTRKSLFRQTRQSRQS